VKPYFFHLIIGIEETTFILQFSLMVTFHNIIYIPTSSFVHRVSAVLEIVKLIEIMKTYYV